MTRRTVPIPAQAAVVGAAPLPATPKLGEIVHFVMDDGVTIRPAIVVAFVDDRVNLQVFVDGSDDGPVRGPYALGTFVDWKRDVAYSVEYVAGTWHRADE